MDKDRACEILGISLDHKENAKKAYLRLSREKHPDRGGSPEEFLLVHEAYQTLVAVDKPEDFREEKLEFQIKVSLEEAVFGVTVETHIRPHAVSTSMIPCSDKATAHVDVLTVTERIPPMVLLQKPMTFEYPEEVVRGSTRKIYISYSIREHERYRICRDRSKALLSVEQTVPVMVALQGGIVEVETMFGPRKVNIKAGTNIGDSYIIPDHGPLGGLEVVVSGIEMPVVDDPNSLEVVVKRQTEVDEEDRLLKENQMKAEEIRANHPDQDQKKT